jgi:hypothetical protein
MGDYSYGPSKLALKGGVFLLSLGLALFYPDSLRRFFTYPLSFFCTFHVFWLIVILVLLKRLRPKWNSKISSGKIFEQHFLQAGIDTEAKRAKLDDYKRRMDRGAIKTALYWTAVIVAMGLLLLYGVLNNLALFEIAVFFIFMDQFCVTIWCPFEWIINNKCCESCRINNWGYFMAFSPLTFIPSFWTYSILFLSVVIIVQWEYLYHRYPERISELYNANLMCKNCQTKCEKRKG